MSTFGKIYTNGLQTYDWKRDARSRLRLLLLWMLPLCGQSQVRGTFLCVLMLPLLTAADVNHPFHPKPKSKPKPDDKSGRAIAGSTSVSVASVGAKKTGEEGEGECPNLTEIFPETQKRTLGFGSTHALRESWSTHQNIGCHLSSTLALSGLATQWEQQ